MADLLEIALAVFAFLLALGSFGGSLYLIQRALAWRKAVAARLAAPRARFAPPATLMVPTRGDFKQLEPNLRAVLAQDYRGLQIILTVDTRADPLFAGCKSLVEELAPERAKVVAVEDRPAPATASGKCQAHLRALEDVSPESKVMVFADDDIRPPPDWIGKLIAALGDDSVSVATAYRWYFSEGGRLASHIRSAWNLVGAQIMFSPKYNFAWGGGMALRRADFDRWDIAAGWHRAISDDYVVTTAAKKDGRRIEFVPETLVASYETLKFRGVLEWCRRQSFMTKIYDPALWKFAVVPYLYFNGFMLLGAALLVAALAAAPLPLWALIVAALWASHFPLNLVKAAIFYRGVPSMLGGHDEEFRRLFLPFLAGAALAPFVMIYALVKTRDLRVIEWRGKRYEVHGPLDVRPL